MTRRKLDEENVRKLTRVGETSLTKKGDNLPSSLKATQDKCDCLTIANKLVD